jgi:ATP-dependent Clp protease protease subunit
MAPPISPEKPTTFWGVFSGAIDQNSFQKFLNTFTFITHQEGLNKHLHLLFQSNGGLIADGVALYNFVKTAPMDVSLYNSGTLQSMATVVFLAAEKRIVSQYATFMIHRPTCAPLALTVDRLTTVLQSLKIDDERVDAILRSKLNLSETQWTDLRNNEFWFTASDAVKGGIATEIGDFSPPRGAQLFIFSP